MRLCIDEQPRGKVSRALDVQHVGFALRRFRLCHVTECHRKPRKRSREHAKRQPGEVLLHVREPRFACGFQTGRRRWRRSTRSLWRRGRRQRGHWELDQLLAIESDGRRLAFLRGDFVFADVFVRQLDRDLELDRNQVLAADLPRAAGGDDGFHGRQFLIAAERLARGGEHDVGRWIDCGGLGEEEGAGGNHDRDKRGENAHLGGSSRCPGTDVSYLDTLDVCSAKEVGNRVISASPDRQPYSTTPG